MEETGVSAETGNVLGVGRLLKYPILKDRDQAAQSRSPILRRHLNRKYNLR